MADDIVLKYSQKDPDLVLNQLKNQLTAVTEGKWTDFLDADIGYGGIIKATEHIESLNSYFTDQQTAEAFLSTAQTREAVIRKAKQLNYIPKRISSSQVQIHLNFPAFNDEINIAANSQYEILKIPFTCKNPIVIPPGTTDIDLTLNQGTPYFLSRIAPGTNWYQIKIPVNTADIVVKVNNVVWQAIDSFIAVPDPQSYRVYEDVNAITILFGANLSTQAPQAGDLIEITGLLSQGQSGNISPIGLPVSIITIIEDINTNDVTNAFTATTTSSAVGGSDAEDINTIRLNAPKFYSTQGRAVTAVDYASIVADIPGVLDVLAIGGEDPRINRYGECHIIVYFSDPYTLSPTETALVYSVVRALNMVTITPVVKPPVVVEVSQNIFAGLVPNVFLDADTGRLLLNNANVALFNSLKIGQGLPNSIQLSALQAVNGITYVDVTTSLVSFANSQAGVVTIPLVENPDVTDVILTDASDNILFQGDATSLLALGGLIYTNATALASDQQCKLKYKANSPDIHLRYDQVLLLKNLVINTTFNPF